MNVLFLILYCLSPHDGLPVKIDEVGTNLIWSVTGKDNLCFLIFEEPSQPVPKMHQMLYDFTTETGIMCADARSKGRTVLLHPSGFVITNPEFFSPAKYFLLNKEGKFVDALHVEAFKGLTDNISISYKYTINESQALFSYEKPTFEKPEDSVVFIGIMDFQTKSFEEIFVADKQKEQHLVWWTPVGNNYLLIDGITGSVDWFEQKSFKRKPLLPAMPERDNPSLGNIEKVNPGKIPGPLRYEHLIESVLVQSKSVTLKRKMYIENELRISYFKISETGSFTESKKHQLVWQHGKRALYFNHNSSEMTIENVDQQAP